MSCSSEEEIAISESEFENYPNDLLKHTSGVGKDTQSRGLREKGIDFGRRGSSAQSTVETTESPKGSDVNELFVWPWMGIVANIHAEWKDDQYVWEGSSRLSEDLTQRGFNPVKVHPLSNQKGHSGYAMVEFNRDCSGFSNALMFEKSYEANHKGKRDYYTAENIGDDLYGWVARSDDFDSYGVVGRHLQKTGDLKTFSEIEAEEKRRTTKLLSNLKEIECKYNKISISLTKLMTQKDEMHKTYNEEIRKMQQNAHHQLGKITKEHERITLHLEEEKRELEQREKELCKREADNEKERRMLHFEKQTNEKATLEKKQAEENVLNLAEDQKRETEKLLKKIVELEQTLEAKEAMELEIERMRETLHTIQRNLEEKEEELEGLEALNQVLIVKEHKSCQELQEARNELINALKEQQPSQSLVGVKRMGELDQKPFLDVAKRKYPDKIADDKALELCSLWENYLRDPHWHPFKVVAVEGGEDHKEIIDEEDARLKFLKNDLGNKAYMAMTAALLEVNKYNPSSRYAVSELWNYNEGREATLKEGVSYVLKQRVLKRKRNCRV